MLSLSNKKSAIKLRNFLIKINFSQSIFLIKEELNRCYNKYKRNKTDKDPNTSRVVFFMKFSILFIHDG